MKKVICFLIILLMCLSLFACRDTGDTGSESVFSDALSTEDSGISEDLASAEALIEQGEYEQAYKLLYGIRQNEKAAELLSGFKVLPLKIRGNGTSWILYTDFKCDNTYDENGLLTGKTEVSNHNCTEVFTYTYDDQGRLITEKRVKKFEGESKSYTEYNSYTYNEHGDVASLESSDLGFTYRINYEYTYSEDGKILSVTDLSSEETTRYVYNDAGQLIEKANESAVYRYTYDKNGNLIKETINEDYEAQNSMTEYTYDSDGRLIQTVTTSTHSGSKQSASCKYEYDEYGILVKEIHSDVERQDYTQAYSDFVYFYSPQE